MQSLLHRCGMVVRGRWAACEIRVPAREIIACCQALLLLGWWLAGAIAQAAPPLSPPTGSPRVTEFAWLGAVAGVEPGSVVRVALPADALTRLQSRAAHDVQVLNAAGEVLPFAVTGADTPLRPRHAVQTRAFALSTTLTHAVADMRTEVPLLAALDIKGSWPRNTLVHLQVAVSDNFQDWVPAPVRGPVYRFDGADSPVNTVLEFDEPLSMEGRYLRISWPGYAGVRLASLTGRVAGLLPSQTPVRAAMGAGTADGTSGWVWALPFATPVRGVHLQLPPDGAAPPAQEPPMRQALPLRISTRSDGAQPWRLLASTVVSRSAQPVGTGSDAAHGGADGAIGQLRVEVGNGLPLPAGGLRLAVELAPVQVLFRATGNGPYTVVAGRPNTVYAGVPLEQLIPGPAMEPEIVPLRPVKQLRAVLPGAPQLWAASLWPAHWSVRGSVLWALLLVVLAGFTVLAWTLLRPDRGA